MDELIKRSAVQESEPYATNAIANLDIPDTRLVVEYIRITSDDFRDFAFANAVRLHGGTNPDFFVGTAVEREAEALLATTRAGV